MSGRSAAAYCSHVDPAEPVDRHRRGGRAGESTACSTQECSTAECTRWRPCATGRRPRRARRGAPRACRRARTTPRRAGRRRPPRRPRGRRRAAGGPGGRRRTAWSGSAQPSSSAASSAVACGRVQRQAGGGVEVALRGGRASTATVRRRAPAGERQKLLGYARVSGRPGPHDGASGPASRPLVRKAREVEPHPQPTVAAAPRRGRSRLALALLPAALLVTGCSGVGGRDLYENSFSLGFPEPVTDRADDIYELWLGSVAAAAVVGVAVPFLILFAAVRYRRVSDKLPRQVRYNLPIEVLYTVVPFVIIAVLFYYTTITQNVVNDLTPRTRAAPTSTSASSASSGTGRSTTSTTTSAVTGIPGQPPHAGAADRHDDPLHRDLAGRHPLLLGAGVPVQARRHPRSRQHLRGHITKEGEYIGRCAELCGEKHAAMNFSVLAVSPDEYEDYIVRPPEQPRQPHRHGRRHRQPRGRGRSRRADRREPS